MSKTRLNFAPTEKLRLVKAEEGRCVKCGQQLTPYNPETGSYAYKTANGAWVTGQVCKTCANRPRAASYKAITRHDYYNERRLRAVMQMQELEAKPPLGRKKPKKAKGKKRGPYGKGFETGNNKAFAGLMAALKKPAVQRFGREKTWKQHWATDEKLRLLFTESYKGMRSFAGSYGYGVGNVHELKKHKENLEKRKDAA